MPPIKMESGKPGESGNSGKPKGAGDRPGRALKQMILDAMEAAGGEAYLTYHAMVNPQLFFPLLGKVLPLQLDGGGEPLNVVHHYIARKSVAPPKKK